MARQYIGNLGKVDNGLVSVNAYGVLDEITFPLTFRVFKPQKRLKADDVYQSKPQLAVALIDELCQYGFRFGLVPADSLYGETETRYIREVIFGRRGPVLYISEHYRSGGTPSPRVPGL